jgi:hypothetical protein
MRFGTDATERMRIDNSGRLLINHTADTAPAGYASKLQLCDTSYQGSSLLIRRDQNNDSAPALLFTKTRSSTKGGSTIVQNGDLTGQIMFFAGDGNDANGQTAYIASAVDGTPGSNDIPGRLTFHTTADGATASTERMRIDNSGQVYIGGTSGLLGKVSVRTTGTTDTSLHLATTGGSGDNGQATNSIRFTGGTNSRWANAKYEAFNHIFHGNGVEQMQIDYTGNATLAGTITANGGYALSQLTELT